MTDAQVEDLKAKKDKLMTSVEFYLQMYEAAAQAQQELRGSRCRSKPGAANDDVVDGDYTKKYNFKEKVD